MKNLFRVFMIVALLVLGFFWYRDSQNPDYNSLESSAYIVFAIFWALILVVAEAYDHLTKRRNG